MSGEFLWYLARAGGFVAFGLVTLSVALGILSSLRVASARWPRAMTTEFHRFVTMTALAFTGIHVLSLIAHPTEGFGIAESLIPFASARDPLLTALGVLGMEMMVAVWLSTQLRSRIGYRRWRRFHYLAFAVFGVTLVHGLGQGTDTGTAWGRLIYLASTALVGGLLALRVLNPHRLTVPGARASGPLPPLGGASAGRRR